MERVRIINADCLEALPTLDSSSIAAVITDPPYGQAVTLHKGYTGPTIAGRYRTLANDHDQSVGSAALQWAASHNLPTITFAHPMKPWPGEWRQHLVWDKGAAVGGLGDYRRTWKHTWELIQVARNRDLRCGRGEAVLRFPMPSGRKCHPAEKSIPLLCYLIEQLTEPGDTILDPFMGSGTTGVAALETGRRFIGIEKDEAYFKLAQDRLAAVQPSLEGCT